MCIRDRYCHNAFATVNLLVQGNISKQMPFPLIVFTVLVTVFAEHGHRTANIVRQGYAIECHSLCCEYNFCHRRVILSVIITLLFGHMIVGILNRFLSIFTQANV